LTFTFTLAWPGHRLLGQGDVRIHMVVNCTGTLNYTTPTEYAVFQTFRTLTFSYPGVSYPRSLWSWP